MRRITTATVEKALIAELHLDEPRFFLEKWGDRINGKVVSPTFKRKGDMKRQDMIKDALQRVFGPISTRRVGMILAYTPEEWDPFRSSNGSSHKATSRK
jgi:acid stress-induced BolA-like protein IbaG/YrbA